MYRKFDAAVVFCLCRFFFSIGYVERVDRIDDEENSVGVALEFFEIANSIVAAKFCRIFGGRNDLEVIETNDGSFSFVVAKRFKKRKKFVFVLEFENAEIKLGIRKVINDVCDLKRVISATNASGS